MDERCYLKLRWEGMKDVRDLLFRVVCQGCVMIDTAFDTSLSIIGGRIVAIQLLSASDLIEVRW